MSVGRDHHGWIFSDVLRETSVVVAVFFHDLFLPDLVRAEHVLIAFEGPFDGKEILTRLYVLGVGGEKRAFRERQIIDRVEKVGFCRCRSSPGGNEPALRTRLRPVRNF